jgi:hypothetical protein
VLVIDECQVDVALCRGLCAHLNELRAEIKKLGWAAFLLVLAGFAFDKEQPTVFASDASRLCSIFVAGITVSSRSGTKTLRGGAVASYMVVRELILQRGLSRDDEATKAEWQAAHTKIASDQLLLLLFVLAGENMACVLALFDAIAQNASASASDMSIAGVLERFLQFVSKSNNAHSLQAHFAKKLTHRNGLRYQGLSDADKNNILQAARRTTVTRADLESIAKYGILFGERVGTSDNYTVHIEPVYFHYLMEVMCRPCPDAFAISPDLFESAVIAECLLGAVHACWGMAFVTLGTLLKGVQWGDPLTENIVVWDSLGHIGDSLDDKRKDGRFAGVCKEKQKIQSVDHQFMQGPRPPEGVYINAHQAEFADVIVVLPRVVLLVQAKLSLNMAASAAADPNNKIDWGASASGSSYYDEAAKCGMPVPGKLVTKKYGRQDELTSKLEAAFGPENVLFVLWTNKQLGVRRVSPRADFAENVSNSGRHGVVSYDSFDEATAPYQLYFRAISPKETNAVAEIKNTMVDVELSPERLRAECK